ncbi:hypothetical protein [Streptomyces aidingensis]|uniref:Uncharacterized protein n=1 Tax=Streptomyces aidingensis TaxID=910347 RepID=A0A1I1NWK9_9ACTN|nr:hypothetical protein [Streptomyces aidingensis]SFD01845.1 hypothetical protein SAMN05421773_108199 [Streptomyces aidingensis]
MSDSSASAMPFRVEYREDSGEVVVWMTFGAGPKQTMRRKVFTSLEALVVAVTEHRWEAYLQSSLARELTQAAVDHLGANPQRLQQAVLALSDPASTVPLGELLYGPGRRPAPPDDTASS